MVLAPLSPYATSEMSNIVQNLGPANTVQELRPSGDGVPATSNDRPPRRSLSERLRIAVSGAISAVLGLLPHVLHHAGPLAGAALLAGAGGTLLFGALGLLASIPLLMRLRRRFGSWRVPAAALALFATLFSISSFVVGPAISGDDEPKDQPPSSSHESHH